MTELRQYPEMIPKETIGRLIQVFRAGEQLFDAEAVWATWNLIGYGLNQCVGEYDDTDLVESGNTTEEDVASVVAILDAIKASQVTPVWSEINWRRLVIILLRLLPSYV